MAPHDPTTLSNPHAEKVIPAGPESVLREARLQIERKIFLFALKENPRGRFLRITEDVLGRRDTIIVPASGLREFRQVLDELITLAEPSPPVSDHP